MKRNLASALFAGNESLLIHCAEAWLNAGHAVRAVVSTEPAIVQWAHTRGVAVFADEASLVQASGQAFDYLFCLDKPCGVPRELMARAQALAITFHDAPLPRYAGWHAPAWALMAQETSHGVTWLEMTPLGEGRIVRQAHFDIPPGETTLGLQARCYEAGLQSFEALAEAIGRNDLVLGETLPAGPCVDRQQRPPTLGTLDFSRPAGELAALVGALDFGPYPDCPNPVARAKLYLGDKMLLVHTARALCKGESSGAAPGTVLQADADRVRVATAHGDIVLDGFTAPWGTAPGHGLMTGMVLPVLDSVTRAQLAARAPEVGQGERFWQQTLSTLAPVELPYPHKTGVPQPAPGPLRQLARMPLALPARGAATVAGFFGWLSALTGQQRISLLYGDRALQASAQGLECWLSPWVPLTLETMPDHCAQQAAEQAQARIDRMHRAGACPRDLPARLGGQPGAGERWSKLGISLDGAAVPPGAELVLMSDPSGQHLELVGDTAVFSGETLAVMAGHLAVYLQAFEGADAIAEISLLPDAETALLARLNATDTPYDAVLGIHEAIAAQAARTPHSTAVSFRGKTLSYRALQAQASALAERLRLSGVRPGDVIGLCLERGPDLVVGVLAILQTGAAYLPLDPDYPHDRLLYMIEDSGAPLVLTSHAVTARLHIPPEKVFLLHEAEAGSAPVLTRSLAPDRVRRAAYLIYTSGSTGRPKGVVVTHQNVLNFFAGLNACIPHAPPGRWLAETSVCFDISVVELLWTLTHGFAIELHTSALPYLSVADALLQGRVTHLQCTPSMASMLVSDSVGRRALSGLAVLMVGGEALSMKLARELRALVPGAFFNMYGPTETTVWSTACDLATLG
ncbi:MAG: AMP-binding protein, partial [Polaromonas sp.]